MPNATSEQIDGLIAQIGVLEDRSAYLQRKKRLMYPLFKEIAAFNHPKIVDKKASNEEKWQAQNELEIKRRDVYIACCDAWESSPSRISVSLTLEEVDRFLPPEIKVPWRDAAIQKKHP